MHNIKRRAFLATGLALAPGMVLARQSRAADPLRVGFVYVGPVGDYGWTHGHDEGRRAIEEHFGDRVQTSFVESVSEGPDSERVIRQFASSGHGLIFTTSFGYMNPTIKVAKQFPKVKFEHATGYKTADNVSVYNARFYEGRSVCGMMAGALSKSGVVGYIASVKIPEVVMGINAFTLAARKERPDLKVKVIWINSWFDPGKEGDAAKALIDQGADIITQHTDSAAPLQVAEERGVHGFGQASDMRAFAPKAQLTSIIDDWSAYYIARTQAVLDDSWKSHIIWWGMDKGMVVMAPYGPAVPADLAAAADRLTQDIIAGKEHSFVGPIFNQEGKQVIASGETIADEDLLKMDWYVQGVQA